MRGVSMFDTEVESWTGEDERRGIMSWTSAKSYVGDEPVRNVAFRVAAIYHNQGHPM
jgi:hypothetical protein